MPSGSQRCSDHRPILADPVAPDRDEIEFSAFGPGYGECLLVHLGQQEWMIVDSCVDADRLPVLDYLASIGVDPATGVKLIVATHWHDDHVRGISDLMAASTTAGCACSAALSPRQLLQAICQEEPELGEGQTSGIREMRSVLARLVETCPARPQPLWAVENRVLYEREGPLRCQVRALSPCDRVLLRAYRDILSLVRQGHGGRVRTPNLNLGSVVLWVKAGDATMLLGADLQQAPDPCWADVLQSRAGLQGRAEIFKVPHHGSENGHLDKVWDDILIFNPDAVVCPNSNGRYDLPTPDDVERLCGLSRLHMTSPGGRRSIARKDRLMTPSVPAFGRVTLRRHLGERAWNVDYVEPASSPCSPPVTPVDEPVEGAPVTVEDPTTS